MDYTQLVPKPLGTSINTGISPLHQATMMEIFGAPSDHPTSEGGEVTNPKLKKVLVTDSVGPFRVTGHGQAVKALRLILARVKAERPELYQQLGSAGMLNARLVRGSTKNWSNHSWGFAIDLKINGRIDSRGDGMVMQGMLDLYPAFHSAGWYWGAGFPTEDAMHFEAGDELVRSWHAQGLLLQIPSAR